MKIGRLVEVAAVAVTLAAEHQLSSLVAADLNVALDALELSGRDHRAHLDVGLEAAADPQSPLDPLTTRSSSSS